MSSIKPKQSLAEELKPGTQALIKAMEEMDNAAWKTAIPQAVAEYIDRPYALFEYLQSAYEKISSYERLHRDSGQTFNDYIQDLFVVDRGVEFVCAGIKPEYFYKGRKPPSPVFILSFPSNGKLDIDRLINHGSSDETRAGISLNFFHSTISDYGNLMHYKPRDEKFLVQTLPNYNWAHFYAYCGDAARLQQEIETNKDLDINEVNELGFTPLQQAVRVNSVAAAAVMLKSGAEVNAEGFEDDPDGFSYSNFTALHKVQSSEMAKLLLNAGASPHAEYHHKTPFFTVTDAARDVVFTAWTAYYADNPRRFYDFCTDLLRKHGANKTIRDFVLDKMKGFLSVRPVFSKSAREIYSQAPAASEAPHLSSEASLG